MAKKDNYTGFLIAIAIIVASLIIAPHLNFNIGINPPAPQPYTPAPDKVQNQNPSYTASLSLIPNNICVGATSTGTINSNINNGVASIFMRTPTTTWTLWNNVNLNANGDYSQVGRVNVLGTADFQAVCCDVAGSCKISNTATLTVRDCDTDGDGANDSVDPDDDNDGYSDEEEIEAGTDPKDEDSFPECEECSCNDLCISKGFTSGRGPFASSTYCTGPEVAEFLHGSSGDICCCLPHSEPCTDSDGGATINVKGTCTSPISSGTDYCVPADYSTQIHEYQCISGVCSSSTVPCPSGWICVNGACINSSTDSDGDGYSDAYEIEQGTNPNDANSHPLSSEDIMCANYCKDVGFSGSLYYPSWTEAYCDAFAQNKCVNVLGIPYIDSFYATIQCCCFQCDWS